MIITGLLSLDDGFKIEGKKMSKYTMDSAVQEAVNILGENGRSFSAYDVTCHVREKVNNGEWFITDRGPSSEGHQCDVQHSDVRNIVGSLGLNVIYNGIYREFSMPNTVITPTVTSKLFPQDVIDQITDYIEGKEEVGQNPTLKQIQSTIRRKGNYTCEQLEKLLKTLGFVVSPALNSDALSQAKVYTF